MIARSRAVHEWCDNQLVDYGRYMLRRIKLRFLIPQVKHLFVAWHLEKRYTATDPNTIILDEKQQKRSAFAQKKLQRQGKQRLTTALAALRCCTTYFLLMFTFIFYLYIVMQWHNVAIVM